MDVQMTRASTPVVRKHDEKFPDTNYILYFGGSRERTGFKGALRKNRFDSEYIYCEGLERPHKMGVANIETRELRVLKKNASSTIFRASREKFKREPGST